MKLLFIYLHVISLAVAIGTAFVTEYFLANAYKTRDSSFLSCIDQLSNFIKFSLLALWVTGFSLLYIGYMENPDYILNQKIWAKLFIVLAISANGVYIEKFALPKLKELYQFKTINIKNSDLVKLSFAFSISASGWLFSIFLGLAKFLNDGYSMQFVLSIYVVLTFAFFAMSYIMIKRMFSGEQVLEAVS